MRRIAIFIASIALSAHVSAQAQPAVEWTSVVSSDWPDDLVEAELAVYPGDPKIVATVGMSTDTKYSVVYVSTDGGRTWSDGKQFPGGDPTLAFDNTGAFLVSTITPQVRVWRSTDGIAWQGWAATDLTFDRQWLAVDPTHLADIIVGGKVYPDGRDVIALARWNDERDTVTVDILPSQPRGFLHVVTDVLFSRDGHLLLTYYVHLGRTGNRPAELTGEQHVLMSDDGGATWKGPFTVGNRLDFANDNRSMAMKGLGGSGMALDESDGRFDGRAYIAWVSAINGYLQVQLMRSPDGGINWEGPVGVNDGGRTANHSTPAVAVTGEGTVVVSWYDRRADAADACFELYVAISRDGGETFSTNAALSDQATCMPEGSRWMNGGDTIGLQPVSENEVIISSIERINDRLRLVARRLNLAP